MTRFSSSTQLNIAIFFLYLFLAVILTYPAVTALFQPHAIPGTGIDSKQMLWNLWWVKHSILTLGVAPTFTESIFHPSGGILFLQTPFNEIVSATLQPLFGLTQTFTLLWLLTFPVAAFTTYLLAFQLTQHRPAAIIAGLIFAFSARQYAQANYHLNVMTIQWLPLYTLALYLLFKRISGPRLILVTISLVLAIASEYIYYLVYYIIPVTLLLLAYQRSARYPRDRALQFWVKFGLAALLGLLIVSPVYYPIFQTHDEPFVRKSGVIWNSADLAGYLLPAQMHPVFGDWVRIVYQSFENNPDERTTFIGFIPLILALIGLMWRSNPTTKFWAVTGSVALLFSLGPILQARGHLELQIEEITTNIVLPYALLNDLPLLNVLRVPARLSIWVQLAIALLAGFGLTVVLNFRHRHLLVAIVVVAILFESLAYFPYPIDNTTLTPPSIYERLADTEDLLAVLELPARSKHDVYYYMYYATQHRHPLVGGLAARTPSEVTRFLESTAFIRESLYPEDLLNLPNPYLQTQVPHLARLGPSLLERHGIGYVILHRDHFDRDNNSDGQRSEQQQALELLLHKSFGAPFYDDGQHLGYRVTATHLSEQDRQEFVVWGDGWYPIQTLFNNPVRLMRQTGTIIVYVPQSQSTALSLIAFAPGTIPIDVTLSLNGQLIADLEFQPLTDIPDRIVAPAFVLNQGFNTLEFRVKLIQKVAVTQDKFMGVFDLTLQNVE